VKENAMIGEILWISIEWPTAGAGKRGGVEGRESCERVGFENVRNKRPEDRGPMTR
jgi:hypothetical protein